MTIITLLRLSPDVMCPIVDFYLLFTSKFKLFPLFIVKYPGFSLSYYRLIDEIILLSVIFLM
jgi:hypothetical protein